MFYKKPSVNEASTKLPAILKQNSAVNYVAELKNRLLSDKLARMQAAEDTGSKVPEEVVALSTGEAVASSTGETAVSSTGEAAASSTGEAATSSAQEATAPSTEEGDFKKQEGAEAMRKD